MSYIVKSDIMCSKWLPCFNNSSKVFPDREIHTTVTRPSHSPRPDTPLRVITTVPNSNSVVEKHISFWSSFDDAEYCKHMNDNINDKYSVNEKEDDINSNEGDINICKILSLNSRSISERILSVMSFMNNNESPRSNSVYTPHSVYKIK